MAVIMLTEPAHFVMEGDGVQVTLRSRDDKWEFRLTRHDFRQSVESARLEIDTADRAQSEVIALCARSAH